MWCLWVVAIGCDRGVADGVAKPVPAAVRGEPAPRGSAPKVVVVGAGGEAVVNVEVVATEAQIHRGLMFRQHLPPDAGMLFVMPVAKDWTFWMRNTLIPLDMIFVGEDMRVAGVVERAEPKTDTLRSVGAVSRYVLEVNGGWAQAHGVGRGAGVRFEGVAGTTGTTGTAATGK